MEHDEAARQKATERYLLDELDPELRDQFEEHLFDCQDCALDLRAGAMLIEQSKVILSEPPAVVPAQVVVSKSASSGWSAWWLRPAFAVPVLAVLLAVIAYQNRTNSHLQDANGPQLLASAVVNVNVRGTEPISVPAHAGEAFELSLNVPPDSRYTSYKLELHGPQGRLEWSRTIPASGSDTLSLYVPGSDHAPGTLAIFGVTVGGESVDLGQYPIELQNQK